MPTIKYRVLSQKPNSTIYVRFSIKRGQVLQVKTPFLVDAKNWNFETSKPIQKRAKNKILLDKLRDLETYIFKSYDRDLFNKEFTNDWLRNQIERFGKGIDVGIDEEKLQQIQEEKEKDILVSYTEKYHEKRKKKTNISKQTNEKSKTLLNKLIEYQKHIKKTIRITGVNEDFLDDFKYWLMNDCKLMESTANRTLKNLKSVLLDAGKKGIKLNPEIFYYKIQSVESEKVFLSFEEIEQIKNAKIIGENNLTIARDWLIIGCYTGQRVSDLLRMDKTMIYTKINNEGKEFELIELTQQKTGSEVSIPIHQEVKEILKKYDHNFPPVFSETSSSNETLFNRYLKQVCKIAGINTLVKGKVYDEKLERNVIEEKEKYNFVSSHICRRSFATNFYADARFTTPQIMAITGHKTERVFLEYIGKNSQDHALKTAETFAELEENKNVM